MANIETASHRREPEDLPENSETKVQSINKTVTDTRELHLRGSPYDLYYSIRVEVAQETDSLQMRPMMGSLSSRW